MSELTNDEIRRKIAELKGIEVVAQTTTMPDGSSIPTGVLFMKIRNTCGFLPDWPVSIEDAWGLVEEMRMSPASVNVQGDYGEKGFVCYVHPYPTDETITLFEHADTAPRAICLAWLGWKEKQ